MIKRMDTGIGRVLKAIDKQGLRENTIVLFSSDNGPQFSGQEEWRIERFNCGFRGSKGSVHEGGIRVPLLIRWPGGLEGNRHYHDLVHFTDWLPTFIDLCGLQPPEGVEFDGASFADYVTGREPSRPDRTQILQIRQSTDPPEQWTNAVMTGRWRLVYGKELYDIAADPGQQNDVAEVHPDVVRQLRAEHDAWWAEMVPTFDEYCHISLGNEAENPTCLDAMDVMGDVAWHQTMIVKARKSTGRWNAAPTTCMWRGSISDGGQSE